MASGVLHKPVSANDIHAQFGRYVAYQPAATFTYQSGMYDDRSDATVYASGHWNDRFTGVDYKVTSV